MIEIKGLVGITRGEMIRKCVIENTECEPLEKERSLNNKTCKSYNDKAYQSYIETWKEKILELEASENYTEDHELI